MDKEVERVRPEYLDPIGKKRSGFPWMLLIGAAVLVLAVLGMKQHMETQAAWEARFNEAPTTGATDTEINEAVQIDAAQAEERLLRLAQIRKQREIAAQQQEEERREWRCINGTPFRKIDGGWENVPGHRC